MQPPPRIPARGPLTKSALRILLDWLAERTGFRLRGIQSASEVGGGGVLVRWLKRGPKGDTGPTGTTGGIGSQGPPGENVKGPTGPRGPKGPDGPVGPKGADGPPGVKGDDNHEAGDDGDLGDKGPNGPKGDKGIDQYGPDGPKGEEGDPGPPGDKTAILKLPDGRNVGLSAQECQDVRFEDILIATIPAQVSRHIAQIDPLFAAVCEPELQLIDALPDAPVPGLRVRFTYALSLLITLPPQPLQRRVVITLQGIRKGHADARQRVWTEQQRLTNEAFYREFHDSLETLNLEP